MKRKGISLIVLVIMIIITIILAAAVIFSIVKSNPIGKAREAVLKNDGKTFIYELNLKISDLKLENYEFDSKTINAFEVEDIKKYIPSFKDKYYGMLYIENGKVCYVGGKVTKEEAFMLETIGIFQGGRISNVTKEEIDADDTMFAIGLTKPEYVVAKFNEDFTEVTIFKNGDDSDGIMKRFFSDSSPMREYASETLISANIREGIKNIGAYSFYECENLTYINLPENLTSIDSYAFSGAHKLKNPELPSTLKVIDDSAFYTCWGIEEIVLPNGLEEIGNNCFSGDHIISLDMPGSVKVIGDYAFSTSHLTNLTLHEGLEKIGEAAFYNSQITSVNVPKTVISIGNRAFFSEELLNIEVDKENNNYCSIDGVLYSKDMINVIEYPSAKRLTDYTIPDSVNYISKYAFQYAKIDNIKLSNNIEIIDNSSFYGAAIKQVTIPNKVTKIGEAAFAATLINEVIIPASVVDIAYNSFGTIYLKDIKVDINNSKYSDINGVLFDKEKTYLVCIPLGKELTEYTVPDTVKTIGREAFGVNNYTLKNITIGPNVTKIDNLALYNSGIDKNIYGVSGSFAEIWANDKKYNFIPM